MHSRDQPLSTVREQRVHPPQIQHAEADLLNDSRHRPSYTRLHEHFSELAPPTMRIDQRVALPIRRGRYRAHVETSWGLGQAPGCYSTAGATVVLDLTLAVTV